MVDIAGNCPGFPEHHIHGLEGVCLEHIPSGYLEEVLDRTQVLFCKNFLDEMGYQIGRKPFIDGKYKADLLGKFECLVLHQVRDHQNPAVAKLRSKTLCDVIAVSRSGKTDECCFHARAPGSNDESREQTFWVSSSLRSRLVTRRTLSPSVFARMPMRASFFTTSWRCKRGR